jgi:hypothetical protein
VRFVVLTLPVDLAMIITEGANSFKFGSVPRHVASSLMDFPSRFNELLFPTPRIGMQGESPK